ncbi:hypothetical protein EVAR_12669_1 [Eumeta japonica]|uniref:Uncharacterized protein n=1 Tax=Eumeta variegata TaxID=151549 RepID=A0A4C1Z1I5_EUMVA|nr:hypothetical protein EVAR_12669_1 [Eumeta japonica]
MNSDVTPKRVAPAAGRPCRPPLETPMLRRMLNLLTAPRRKTAVVCATLRISRRAVRRRVDVPPRLAVNRRRWRSIGTGSELPRLGRLLV